MINSDRYTQLLSEYGCDKIEDQEIRRRIMSNTMRNEIDSFIQGGKLMGGTLVGEGEGVRVQSYEKRLETVVMQLQMLEAEGKLDSLLKEVKEVYGYIRILMEYKNRVNSKLADYADYMTYETENMKPVVQIIEKPVEKIVEKNVEVLREIIPDGYQLVPSGFMVLNKRDYTRLQTELAKANDELLEWTTARPQIKAKPSEVLHSPVEEDFPVPAEEVAHKTEMEGFEVLKERRSHGDRLALKLDGMLKSKPKTDAEMASKAQPVVMADSPVVEVAVQDSKVERSGMKLALPSMGKINKNEFKPVGSDAFL